MTEGKFDFWAVIELFGHQVLSGRVTEASIGGCSFVRVDVPEHNKQPAFTRFLGNGAIYSITPCSEEAAKAVQEYRGQQPINVYVPQLEAPRRTVQPARSYSPPEREEGRPDYPDDYADYPDDYREFHEREQDDETEAEEDQL